MEDSGTILESDAQGCISKSDCVSQGMVSIIWDAKHQIPRLRGATDQVNLRVSQWVAQSLEGADVEHRRAST